MKFVLISPKNRTVYNFRGDLLRKIKDIGYRIIVTGPNKDNIEKIEEIGVEFHEIPMDKNGVSIFSDIHYLLALFKFFKREKPDVILAYTVKPVVYASIAAKLSGVKNINAMITGVGYAFTSPTLKAKAIQLIVGFLYKIGLGCADTAIFQNPDDLQEFSKRKFVKENKCRVVNGSGVNMDYFKISSLPEQTTFFMLSRILRSKGIIEYLKAAEIVKSKHPEVRFMLLGAIEDMQDSLKKVDLEPYINQNIIEYYGETSDVLAYYKQCSVYVLPSYREGTPRTVLEAMAMGRPILTTDAPGCKETVVDGLNGFLVSVKDAQAVAEKMIWFIENKDKIKNMGEESYRLCLEKFDVNKVNNAMLKYMNI